VRREGQDLTLTADGNSQLSIQGGLNLDNVQLQVSINGSADFRNGVYLDQRRCYAADWGYVRWAAG